MTKLIFLNHSFNAFSPTIIMFIFFFFGYASEATDIGLIASLVILVTQIFSSNKRNIIVTTKDRKLLFNTILFRLILGSLIFGITFLAGYKLDLISKINSTFVILSIFFWINELFLTLYEINNHKKLLKKNLTSFLMFFVTLIFLLIFDRFDLIYLLFFSFFIFGFISLFLIYIKNKKKIIYNLVLEKILYSIKQNIFDLSFLSSFSFLLSVFVWRFFIVDFYGKDEAIIFFICFAIASFPASFLNNYIGISLIENNYNSLSYYLKFIILYLIVSYTFFFIQENFMIYVGKNSYLSLSIEVLTISLIGMALMLIGINTRILILNSGTINRKSLFKSDFIYGIIIALIVPFIGYIGYLELIKFSYLISSIFTLIFYFIIKIKLRIK